MTNTALFEDYFRQMTDVAQQRAARMFSNLTKKEQILVFEAAVLGHVIGVQAGQAGPYTKDRPYPADRTVLVRTLLDAAAMSDLYPNLGALDNVNRRTARRLRTRR